MSKVTCTPLHHYTSNTCKSLSFSDTLIVDIDFLSYESHIILFTNFAICHVTTATRHLSWPPRDPGARSPCDPPDLDPISLKNTAANEFKCQPSVHTRRLRELTDARL